MGKKNKPTFKFWEISSSYQKQKRLGDLKVLKTKKVKLTTLDVEAESSLSDLQQTKAILDASINELSEEYKNLKTINETFEKLKLLFEQKNYSKTKQENLPTSWEIITNHTGPSKSIRLKQTKCYLIFMVVMMEQCMGPGIFW